MAALTLLASSAWESGAVPRDTLYIPGLDDEDKLKAPRRLGVIDLGSRSIRVSAHEAHPDGSLRKMKLKNTRPVMLGHGVFTTGQFNAESREATLAAFSDYTKILDDNGVAQNSRIAVATCALRDVEEVERIRFILEVKEKTGIDLQVISGTLEARLISHGILNGEHAQLVGGFNLFIDIGGGSAEIGLGHKHAHLASYSLPLGAVRMTEVFNIQNPASEESWKKMRDEIRRQAETTQKQFQFPHVVQALGSSGTISAVNDLMQEWGYSASPFRTRDLKDVLRRLRSMPHDEIGKLKSIGVDRAGVILAGATILREIARAFDIDTVQPTEFALMDGVLDFWVAQLFKSHN